MPRNAVKVGIGSDHRGFELKTRIIALLEEKGYPYVDIGCHDRTPVDYPDVAGNLGDKVSQGVVDLGILICGSGIGMSIAANKIVGIRAALCGDELSARMSRQHNDANILCLGGEMIGAWQAFEVVMDFVGTKFAGGRHAQRVNKLAGLDTKVGRVS